MNLRVSWHSVFSFLLDRGPPAQCSASFASYAECRRRLTVARQTIAAIITFRKRTEQRAVLIGQIATKKKKIPSRYEDLWLVFHWILHSIGTIKLFRLLVVGICLWMSGLDFKTFHAGFVIETMPQRKLSLWVLRFSRSSAIPLTFRNRVSYI
jgi:hypothetical protein